MLFAPHDCHKSWWTCQQSSIEQKQARFCGHIPDLANFMDCYGFDACNLITIHPRALCHYRRTAVKNSAACIGMQAHSVTFRTYTAIVSQVTHSYSG